MLDKVTTGSRRDELYLVYEEALRHNPGDRSLERHCVDLALELQPERTADAKRHLRALLAQPERLKKNPRAADAARELAELKEVEGKCLLLESDFEAAANRLQRGDLVRSDPSGLLRSARPAQAYRTSQGPRGRRRRDRADGREQPQVRTAHLYRFRYALEFRLPAGDNDLKNALELAPEDPEVFSPQRSWPISENDPPTARTYLEKGLKLHPRNVELALALARLELQEQHPDRAETVLRQVYRDNPPADLAFLLAEALILQRQD